jgi:hypothetical protein
LRFLLVAALVASAPVLAVPEPMPRCAEVGRLEVHGLGTPEDDLARIGELTGAVAPGPRLIRRGGSRVEVLCQGGDLLWPTHPVDTDTRAGKTATLLPLRLSSAWNSRYPSGQNDGLLWAGRGVSQELSFGVALRRGILSASIAPEAAWSENRAFEIVPNGRDGALRFGDTFYGGTIDLPQRFGRGPYASWSLGQSHLRVDRWNVGLGISTENLWFGPGIRNAIVMSNAAPGFPHVFAGTSHPADIRIGTAEALVFWGRLERSRFFDGGHPLMSGLVVTYGPRWTPGLTFGLARTMIQPWDDLRLRDYLSIFQSFAKENLDSWYGPGGDNPLDNQLASVFARWVFPEAGLELYGEWAREDHDWSWWGFIRDPDHSAAWLAGLQKVFRAGDKLVRVHAEVTSLQQVRPPGSERGMPVYYVHPNDLGYTNEGQLLGAWIGPGADAQTLAVDVFHRGGRIGGYVERVRRNEAYYWNVVDPTRTSWPHDAELTAAVRQVLRAGRFAISWEAAASWRQNRDFIRDEPNFRLGLSLALPFTQASAASPPASGTSLPPP